MMVLVELLALKSNMKSRQPQQLVQKFKKVIQLKKERFSAFSEMKKYLNALSDVMTLVQVVYQ